MPAKDTKTPLTDNGFSLISDEKLLALYAALLKCRMLARRMGTRGKQSESSLAVAVGVAIDLLAGDALATSGAGSIARFVKSRFAAEAALRRIPDTRSDAGFRSARERCGDAVLKAALRAAHVRKTRVNTGEKGERGKEKWEKWQVEKSAKIAVALCAHASDSAQVWRASLREAASKRLPILFISCAEEEVTDVASLAPKHRFPVIVVDSHDVVAMYRVASEAIAHARRGNGPTLIVCRPWPLSDRHTVHDHDPIVNMEKYLARKRLFSAQFKARTIAAFARELRATALKKTPRA